VVNIILRKDFIMSDYIPSSDTQFIAWGKTFLNYLTTNYAALGLTQEEVSPISADFLAFEVAFNAHNTAAQAASAAKETKNTNRSTAEETIRSIVREIQANPDVTDTQRAGLGITVKNGVVSVSAAASGESRPVGQVNTSQRLRHEISFVDESTPTSRAKPKGVMGCEIWNAVTAVGEAVPVDVSSYSFVALDTASPYVTEYAGSQAGKTAHYLLRWVMSGGDKGPWSETVSATIVG
jgi:hypothetical protein